MSTKNSEMLYGARSNFVDFLCMSYSITKENRNTCFHNLLCAKPKGRTSSPDNVTIGRVIATLFQFICSSITKLRNLSTFQVMKPGELAVQVLLLLTLVPSLSQAGSYKNATSIFSTLLEKSNYNPQVRPLLDQDSILYVYVGFEIFSIMEVNDADQSFRCNGQLSMVWFDEVSCPNLCYCCFCQE